MRIARSYMLLAGVLAALLPSAGAGQVSGAAGRTVLVVGGTTVTAHTHAIVIPAKPAPSERYAATELRDWLTSATGECLPIAADCDGTTRVALAVGHAALLAGHLPALDTTRLGTEGMAIRTDGPVLLLAGNKRGVLYAVYSFLQDNMGFRWLTPDCTVLPAAGVIRVDDLDTSHTPRFATRALDYWSAFNQDWAARNKVNGYGYAKKGSIDEAHGGEAAYPDASCFWSTLRFFIPIDKYRATHPEYFSQIGGRRVTSG